MYKQENQKVLMEENAGIKMTTGKRTEWRISET